MTRSDTTSRADPAPYDGPRCRACGGPCVSWKGSTWGYTCQACITQHLEAAATRADERDRRSRERLLARAGFDAHNDDSPRVGERASGR